LIEVDVASCYPSLIAANGITPATYGKTASQTYRDILARRLEVKRQAKAATDPEELATLDIQATSLKLILNSFFGKTGSPYSTLYDPEAFLAITISGQLMLIYLIERMGAEGIRTLTANTDGLVILAPRGSDRWREVIAGWERDTSMSLEINRLERLVTIATNTYATMDVKGMIKRRGAKLKGELEPDKSPNNLVVNDALAEALLRDVPPERTIRACDDPV
jgi:DNA polymerase elongation subunit (family B)